MTFRAESAAERMAKQGLAASGTVFTSPGRETSLGDMTMKASAFAYSDDDVPYVGFVRVRGGSGEFGHSNGAQTLRGRVRPGSIVVRISAPKGESFWPDLHVQHLAMHWRRAKSLFAGEAQMRIENFDGCRFHSDPLVEQLIESTLDQAHEQALSSVFFDHAYALVAFRLSGKGRPAATDGRKLDSRAIGKIVDYIEANLAKDIGLIELAAMTSLSVAEFSRRFKQSIGQPPYAFVTQRRIRRAMELMLDQRTPIETIAETVGFNRPSNFARAFRNIAGISPRQWRGSR